MFAEVVGIGVRVESVHLYRIRTAKISESVIILASVLANGSDKVTPACFGTIVGLPFLLKNLEP